jgi:hypothetical protein
LGREVFHIGVTPKGRLEPKRRPQSPQLRLRRAILDANNQKRSFRRDWRQPRSQPSQLNNAIKGGSA